jgi:adenine-specific DNA-methyltransferase
MSEPARENTEFLARQLITCIGNKRALLDFIGEGIKKVQKRLGRNRLKIFDVFSGSGIAARYFKRFSDLLIVNDLEKYSAVINQCYLSNRSDLNIALLRECYLDIIEKSKKNVRGIISRLYAPKDDNNIGENERVFYTARNAAYIDTVRQLVDGVPPEFRCHFLAPLLSEASIHANTSGVFKGFYKNKKTGAGQFGGANRDALYRITGDIRLPFPVFSNFNCETLVYSEDANGIVLKLPEVDAAYLDPPYNQHPYGSNYFMLNLITEYRYPEKISRVSGIPCGWNRSRYNKKNQALDTLTELVMNIQAKFLLISFNSEGFISPGEMQAMLSGAGSLEVLETRYNVFRGGRNLGGRGRYVSEYLYVLEKDR